ncbi:MAG: diacylglycerol kinase family lipid kinase [Treponema sp.]|nr:diacylglycerol kinase family lipid kinase [Treponema sp.]MCL2236675.1 diacylglycerol kinase family lipid kinase [Treponema sp.]
MEQGNIWVILNPTAGKGKAKKQCPKIDKILKESGRKYQIIQTQSPGHAIELIRNLSIDENDIVVAAGGDGTCNEVVNGLLSRKEKFSKPPVFGLLPIGRGNDFSSTPNLPLNIDDAIKIILNGNIRPLDAGIVKGGFFPDGRYFINGVGIGFDTKVGFEAAKMKIKSGFSYMIGALKMLARFEMSPLIQIKYDNREETLHAILVSVVNGRRMGGSFYMGPNAILDDGLLDICYVKHPAKRSYLLKIFSHYTKGTQSQCDGVFMSRGLKFKLRALEGSMAVHCDGETVCFEGKELEIECIPGALRFAGF